MLRMTTQTTEVGVPEDTFEMRLVIARTYRGFRSAAAAGAAVGVSRQTWIDWETGKSPGAKKPAMLAYIAQQMRVKEEWLREGGPLRTSGDDDNGGDGLPRLDSNQEPSGYPPAQVIELWRESDRAAA